MPVDVGPDGFVSARGNPDHALHALLNTHLAAREEERVAGGCRQAPDLGPFKKALTKEQLIALIKAVLGRIDWLRQNAGGLPHGRECQRHLFALLEPLYALKLPYTEADLCAILQMTASLAGVIPPYGPVEQVIAFTRKNPLTPQLCGELRALQASLREEMSINQTMAQQLRQRLHMLLWHDEWDAVDPKRCWSEYIRRAYREMSGERRTKWRALLYHIRGDGGTKPPASWVKEAQGRLDEVGLDEVRACFCAWLTLVRSGEPLPLSVAGSHVLKGLLWYCAVARDPALNQAALCLVDARWKPKRNAEKCTPALIQLLETMPLDLAREPMARLEQSLAGARLRQLNAGLSEAGDLMSKVLQQVATVAVTPQTVAQVSRTQKPCFEHRTVADLLGELGGFMAGPANRNRPPGS